MRGIFLIAILILDLALFCSCNKDEDSQPPVINFIEPAESLFLLLPDTVRVVAEVRDETNITVVEVSLVNEHGIPIVTGGFYYPDTSFYKVTSYLSITDKSITSGTYTIKVTASDYYNITNAYRSIFLNEIPQELMGYIAVTASYPFESKVIRLDPQFNTDTSFVFPKGFQLSGFHGLWEQFYFVSPEPSVLYAFNASGFELLYEFAAWLPRPVFSSVLTDQQLLFSTMNGDAGILNSEGQIVIITQPQPGKTIQCFAADENYLYAEMVSLSGDIREITAFYRVTGAIRVQRLVSNDIVALEPAQGKALLISNSETNTIISEFDPEDMIITDLKSLVRQEISSTLKINEKDFLIFTEHEILLYEYDLNYVSEYLPGSYAFGRYDHLSDRLYLVRDSAVEIFNPIASFPTIIPFNEPVKDFHLVFNKK
jgi:hypothetical protein